MTGDTPIAQEAQGSASTSDSEPWEDRQALQETGERSCPELRGPALFSMQLLFYTHTLKGGKVQEGTESRIK